MAEEGDGRFFRDIHFDPTDSTAYVGARLVHLFIQ